MPDGETGLIKHPSHKTRVFAAFSPRWAKDSGCAVSLRCVVGSLTNVLSTIPDHAGAALGNSNYLTYPKPPLPLHLLPQAVYGAQWLSPGYLGALLLSILQDSQKAQRPPEGVQVNGHKQNIVKRAQ